MSGEDDYNETEFTEEDPRAKPSKSPAGKRMNGHASPSPDDNAEAGPSTSTVESLLKLRQENATLRSKIDDLKRQLEAANARAELNKTHGSPGKGGRGLSAVGEKELENAFKLMEIYKKSNEVYKRQLNSSLNPEKLAQLNNEIAEKDRRIQQLLEENKTLKAETRRLGKEFTTAYDMSGDYPMKVSNLLDELKAVKEKLRHYVDRHNKDEKMLRVLQAKVVDYEHAQRNSKKLRRDGHQSAKELSSAPSTAHAGYNDEPTRPLASGGRVSRGSEIASTIESGRKEVEQARHEAKKPAAKKVAKPPPQLAKLPSEEKSAAPTPKRPVPPSAVKKEKEKERDKEPVVKKEKEEKKKEEESKPKKPVATPAAAATPKKPPASKSSAKSDKSEKQKEKEQKTEDYGNFDDTPAVDTPKAVKTKSPEASPKKEEKQKTSSKPAIASPRNTEEPPAEEIAPKKSDKKAPAKQQDDDVSLDLDDTPAPTKSSKPATVASPKKDEIDFSWDEPKRDDADNEQPPAKATDDVDKEREQEPPAAAPAASEDNYDDGGDYSADFD